MSDQFKLYSLAEEIAASADRVAAHLDETGFASRVEALRRHGFFAFDPWPSRRLPGGCGRMISDAGSELVDVLHHGRTADLEMLREDVVAHLHQVGFISADGKPGKWELTAFRGVLAVRDRETHGGKVYIGEDGLRFVDSILDVRPHGRALDVGCGTGLLACSLARSCDDVVAIDVVAECLAATQLSARLNRVAEKIITQHVSLEDYQPSGRFNCITANLPGVPVPPGIRYSPEGDGGPDGLSYMRMLLARAPGLLDPADGTLLMRFQSLGNSDGPLLLHDLRAAARCNNWDIVVVTDSRVPVDVRSAHTTYYARKYNPNMSVDQLLATADGHMAGLGMSGYFASTLVARTGGSGQVQFIDLSIQDLLDVKVVLRGQVSDCRTRRTEILSHFYGRAHGLPDGFLELGDLDDLAVVAARFDNLADELAEPTTVRDLVRKVFGDRLISDALRVRWLYVTVELLIDTMVELGLTALWPEETQS